MADSGGRGRRVRACLPLTCGILFCHAPAAAEELLVDRIVATVGQSAITLRDVRHHAWLSRTLEQSPPESWTAERARDSLVRNVLIKNYLVTTGLLAQTPADDVEDLRKQLRRAFRSDGDFSSALKELALSEERLRAILEEHLQVRHFLERVLPARVTLNEKEVQAYYDEKKETRFLGKPLQNVETLVRADLKREKTRKEFEKWIETERRRTEVTLIPPEAAEPEPAASPSPPSGEAKSPSSSRSNGAASEPPGRGNPFAR